MKRILSVLTLIGMLTLPFIPGIPADAAEGDVALTEENFPDNYIRETLLADEDKNKDGILSADEIKQITSLHVMNDDADVSTIKGLEKLTSLEELYMTEGFSGDSIDLNALAPLKVFRLKTSGNVTITMDQQTSLEDLRLEFWGGESSDTWRSSLKKQIQNFKNLKTLYLDGCGFTDLDLSGFPKLESLSCEENNLKSLDLSGLSELEFLDCSDNPLTSLNVSHNPKLSKLDCSRTKVKVLDLRKNRIKKLECVAAKKLKKVNLNGQTSLQYLSCYGAGKLQSLSLKRCGKLKELNVSETALKKLDVSYCTKLEQLDADNVVNLKLYLQDGQKLYTGRSYTDDDYSFRISDRTVASISKKGTILAKKPGKATVQKRKRDKTNDILQNCTWTLIVKPKTQSVVSAKKAAATAICLQWKKQASVTGYQVQCSTDKAFGKNVRSIKLSGKTRTTLRNLKKGKTYYVRVRSYKVTGKKTYYGNYSTSKKVAL